MADDEKPQKPGLLRKALGRTVGAALGPGKLSESIEKSIAGSLSKSRSYNSAGERRAPPGVVRRVAGNITSAALGPGRLPSSIAGAVRGSGRAVPGTHGKKAVSEAKPTDTQELQNVAEKVAQDINALRSDVEQGLTFVYGEVQKTNKLVQQLRQDMRRKDPNASTTRLNQQMRDARGRFTSNKQAGIPAGTSVTDFLKANPKNPENDDSGLGISDILKALAAGAGGAATAGIARQVLTKLAYTAGRAGGSLVRTLGPLAAVAGATYSVRKTQQEKDDFYNQLVQKQGKVKADQWKHVANRGIGSFLNNRLDDVYQWMTSKKKDEGNDATQKAPDQPAADGDKNIAAQRDLKITSLQDIFIEAKNELTLKGRVITIDAERIKFKGKVEGLSGGEDSGKPGQPKKQEATPKAQSFAQVRQEVHASSSGAYNGGMPAPGNGLTQYANPGDTTKLGNAPRTGSKTDPGSQQQTAAPSNTKDGTPAPKVKTGLPGTDEAIQAAAKQYNLDPNTLRAVASIESSMNPDSNRNKQTQYKGLYQIGHNEWKKYGEGGDIYNPRDNSMAAAHMLADHRDWFKKKFNRDPTDGELYIMHQQGRGFFTPGVKLGQDANGITNASGNPYPGMKGPQTHETFLAGWDKELERRKSNFADYYNKEKQPEKQPDKQPQTVASSTAQSDAAKAKPEFNVRDQMARPYYMGGSGTMEGYGKFRWGSGGGGRGSIPYGDYPITPDAVGAWGQAHDAIGVNNGLISDPKYPGAPRTGIEIHASSSRDLDRMYTEGCFSIPAKYYPQFKGHLLREIEQHGPLYLHVGKDGQASINHSQGGQQVAGTEGVVQAPQRTDTNTPTTASVATPTAQQKFSPVIPGRPASVSIDPNSQIGGYVSGGKLSQFATYMGRNKIIAGLGKLYNKLPQKVQDHLRSADQIDFNQLAPYAHLLPEGVRKEFEKNGVKFTDAVPQSGGEPIAQSATGQAGTARQAAQQEFQSDASKVPQAGQPNLVPTPDTTVQSGQNVTRDVMKTGMSKVLGPDQLDTQSNDEKIKALQSYANNMDAKPDSMDLGAGDLDKKKKQADAELVDKIPTPDTTIPSGEDVTADVKASADSDSKKVDNKVADSGGVKSTGTSSSKGSLRAPVNNPESEAPSPGSDGYGAQTCNPDGAGLCAI